MTHVQADDGCRLFHRFDGPKAAPVVLLSNSLGTALEMWDAQVGPLMDAGHRVLRYDGRGHGRSDSLPGDATIERLGRDALALLDGLGLDRVAFCGLSMGGMVGQWLGIHAGNRVSRLVLANTSAKIGAPEVWEQRIATVRARGMDAIVPGVIERWFTAGFREREPASVERIAAMLRATDPLGYAGCCAAVRDMDQEASLGRIEAPTLVVAGTHDQATPPEHARAIQAAIPDAAMVELSAAHLSNVEQADVFTLALLGFLDKDARAQA